MTGGELCEMIRKSKHSKNSQVFQEGTSNDLKNQKTFTNIFFFGIQYTFYTFLKFRNPRHILNNFKFWNTRHIINTIIFGIQDTF